MNPELFSLFREAAAQGLGSKLWLLVVIAISASAITAFFMSYLKKKAELTALDEQFRKSLLQLQEQTRAIENIKAEISAKFALSTEEIKADLAKDLEAFRIGLQDRMKRESEFVTFRYTKLFSAFEELSGLPGIDYTYLSRKGDRFIQDQKLLKKVVAEASERYRVVKEIFERVCPLMDQPLLEEVSRSIAEEERLSGLLIRSLYEGTSLPEGIDLNGLLEVRQRAEREIKTVFAQQVATLTATAS